MGRQEQTSSCGAASDQDNIVREVCKKKQKYDQEKIVNCARSSLCYAQCF